MVETKFRPGPLRKFLCAQGKNIDRAYSPRAYVAHACDKEFLKTLEGMPDHEDGMSPVDGDIFVFTVDVQEEARDALLAKYPCANILVPSESRVYLKPILTWLLGEEAADPVVVVRSLESDEATKGRFFGVAYDLRVRAYLAEEKSTLFFDGVDENGNWIISPDITLVPYESEVWTKLTSLVPSLAKL